MWGRGERVIVTNGLSKAYGLPGLRIGWMVGPPALVASTWSYHDYITIAPGALSDLPGAGRARTRAAGGSCSNGPAASSAPTCRCSSSGCARTATRSPGCRREAGAICYVRYRHAHQLDRRWSPGSASEKSVLIVPGDHFGMDHYLRIGFGEHAGVRHRGPGARARPALVAARPLHRASRMNGARAVPGPGRLRPRGPALRAAADRGGRPPRFRVAGRRHRHAPPRLGGRSGRRGRRRALAAVDGGPVARSAGRRTAPAQRPRRDPPGGARCWPTKPPRAAWCCVESTVLDIDRGEPALSHVRAALEAQMHVVTVNKGPAAFAYHELESLADTVDRVFFFEGAVMDGVPVFNLVRETMPAVRIDGFRGVINTTVELRPVGARAGPAVRRRACARCRRAASRKPTPRSTSRAGTPRPRPPRWSTC